MSLVLGSPHTRVPLLAWRERGNPFYSVIADITYFYIPNELLKRKYYRPLTKVQFIHHTNNHQKYD
jgi:hypothetical protein